MSLRVLFYIPFLFLIAPSISFSQTKKHLIKPGDSISRPESPTIDYLNQPVYFDQQNKTHFLTNLKKFSNEFQQQIRKSHSRIKL